jgi:hypothetical protein
MPAAEALLEPTMATSGRIKASLRPHGEHRRRVVDHLQARRVVGLAERGWYWHVPPLKGGSLKCPTFRLADAI